LGTYYKNVEPWLDKIDQGAWVELGVDRGEGSTKWFSEHAKTKATRFYGVDMDPDQIERAKNNFMYKKYAVLGLDGQLHMTQVPDHEGFANHIELVAAKGEDFLKTLHEQNPSTKISLMYLDNFDWDYWLGRQEESFVAGVKKRYLDMMNTEMTNLNSQLTHLYQAMVAMPMMAPNSVIICDDTWALPEEGIFSGKCSAVIPYIMLNGYRILHTLGYRQNSGVILGRFSV
jgi:hypothetical protein